jgi:hypothetical protein
VFDCDENAWDYKYIEEATSEVSELELLKQQLAQQQTLIDTILGLTEE